MFLYKSSKSQTNTNTLSYIRPRTCALANPQPRAHKREGTHKHKHIHARTRARARTHTHAHTHTHTHTYTHTHTHTHTHTLNERFNCIYVNINVAVIICKVTYIKLTLIFPMAIYSHELSLRMISLLIDVSYTHPDRMIRHQSIQISCNVYTKMSNLSLIVPSFCNFVYSSFSYYPS